MPPARTAPPLQSLRLVLFALAGGLVTFAAVTVVVRMQGLNPQASDATRVLPFVAAGLFAAAGALWFVIRSRAASTLAPTKDAALEELRRDSVPPQLFAATIAGAAMFEGAGLLGIVTVLLGGSWYTLIVAMAAIVAIAWLVPSRERLEEWVREANAS